MNTDEGKIMRGKIMGRIADSGLEFSNLKIRASCENFQE